MGERRREPDDERERVRESQGVRELCIQAREMMNIEKM